MHMPGFNRAAQCGVIGQQSALAHHLRQRARTHAFGQWAQRLHGWVSSTQ
jgi:hypothetical protein